jgi:drug/metabolite transporter (DMT)-like permease
MNRGHSSPFFNQLAGFVIAVASTALAAACSYLVVKTLREGAPPIAGVFLMAGLVSLSLAFFGGRLMLFPRGDGTLRTPRELTVLATISLIAVVVTLVSAAAHGALAALAPAALVLIGISVRALHLAKIRSKDDA